METERLNLQHYRESEQSEFINLFTDEKVMKFVDTGVYSIEKAERLWRKLMDELYPQGLDTIYAVFEKTSGKYIGTSAIRPRSEKKSEWEITYVLKSEEWGKGYATEIAARLIDFGFAELGLPAIFATVDTDNYASIHVLGKVGMKHIRDEYDELGKFYVYGIIA